MRRVAVSQNRLSRLAAQAFCQGPASHKGILLSLEFMNRDSYKGVAVSLIYDRWLHDSSVRVNHL